MANITFSEGSGVNNSIYGNSQNPIKLMIEKRGEAFEQESIAKQIFRSEKSTHWSEKFTSMTGMDGPEPVGENGAYPTDGMEEGPSKVIEHMTWKDSFSISREIIDDHQMLELRKKPQAFVTAHYRTREKFGAAMLGGAISGNGKVDFRGKKFDAKAADGKNLFAADHPAKIKGGAQSNLFSDAFDEEALGKLETRMQNYFGENGEILDVVPDTILIPNVHSLKKAVFAAIGADKEPTTANNGFNYQFGRWNIIVWPYLNQYVTLTGTAIPWVLMASQYNKDYGSLIWLDRVALEVRSTLDENTDANVWRGYSRWTAGFNDWRGIAVAGVDGAGSLSS